MIGIEMNITAGSSIQDCLKRAVELIESLYGLTNVDFVWFKFNGKVINVTRFTDVNLVLADYLK